MTWHIIAHAVHVDHARVLITASVSSVIGCGELEMIITLKNISRQKPQSELEAGPKRRERESEVEHLNEQILN